MAAAPEGTTAEDHGTPVAPSLTAVQERVSYLRSATEAPAEDGWIRCSELIADGDALTDLVTTTGAGRGTDDPQVAASLFVQAYAFRVAGVALAAYALDLPVPSTGSDRTAIKIARHRPSSIAFLDPAGYPPDADRLAGELLGGHLKEIIAAVRGLVTVGERMLWGNVAASCAVAFRAVEGESPHDDDRARIRARADRFTTAAAPWLDGLGQYVVLEGAARDGWFWERTNCCLWYQASGGSYCDDCSLLGPDERRAAWQAQVDEADEPAEAPA